MPKPKTNKTKKHPGGRPPLFTDPKDMQSAIDEYFSDCDENKRPYTICGLANSIGMCRDTLLEYQKKDEFSDTIKKAKGRVHQYVEESLFKGKAAGPIFNLKNNFGWKDKQEHTHDVSDPLKSLLSKIAEQGPPGPNGSD